MPSKRMDTTLRHGAPLFLALVTALAVTLPARPAAAETTVFVVRHAEKEVDGTDDPPLTADGRERARMLREMLRSVKLSAAYASKYKRTQQTVEPAATLQELPVTVHETKEIAGLAAGIRAAAADSVDDYIVVAGHANTTMEWVKALGIATDRELLDHEWDNLFIVTVGSGGRARLLPLHYGY